MTLGAVVARRGSVGWRLTRRTILPLTSPPFQHGGRQVVRRPLTLLNPETPHELASIPPQHQEEGIGKATSPRQRKRRSRNLARGFSPLAPPKGEMQSPLGESHARRHELHRPQRPQKQGKAGQEGEKAPGQAVRPWHPPGVLTSSEGDEGMAGLLLVDTVLDKYVPLFDIPR